MSAPVDCRNYGGAVSRPVDVLAVLRNVNATTDARYLSMRGWLVEIGEAKGFRTAAAAERFLSHNPEFVGYRVEMVRK